MDDSCNTSKNMQRMSKDFLTRIKTDSPNINIILTSKNKNH